MAQAFAVHNSDRVSVLYNGNIVGTIALTPDGLMAFEYSTEWLNKGFSISPFSLPLEKRVFIANPEPLDGIFGIFADSLPDGWGQLLVNRTLAKNGIDPKTVNPLARLSIVGKSGMGALEFEPESPISYTFGNLDLDTISRECQKILETEYSENLDELFALGGSSGGARPKILTAIEGEDWIIKFPSSMDPKDIGKQEYEIALLAKECGLEFPEVRLFGSKRCSGYFGVKRFDRSGDKKIHMASAGALLETSHRLPNLEYELLFRLTSMLTNSATELEKLYRLMCFNVFVGNRDDHAKNFSFLYEPDSGWRLSPAYDLTVNPGIYGEHDTTVNGKGKNITVEDLVSVGLNAGLNSSKAKHIAKEIKTLVTKANLLAKY